MVTKIAIRQGFSPLRLRADEVTNTRGVHEVATKAG